VDHARGLLGAARRAERASKQAGDRCAGARRRRVGISQHRLEQTADDRERNPPLKLMRPRTQDSNPKARRGDRRIIKQPRLADPGRALDQHHRPSPGRRPRQRDTQLATLDLALEEARARIVVGHSETVPARRLAMPVLGTGRRRRSSDLSGQVGRRNYADANEAAAAAPFEARERID
jgi:hypothetical protein